MPNVTLQTNGEYWQARWSDGLGHYKGKNLGRQDQYTERQALILCRQHQAKLEAGKVVNGQAPTLAAMIERFLAGKTNIGESTRAMYDLAFKYLQEFFSPDLRADAVTPALAKDYRTSLAKRKISESSICRYVRDAKSLFQDATDDELIPRNPFAKIATAAPTPDKTWQYIDLAMLRKLFDAAPSPGWTLLLALCRLAGLRQGEACRLDWSQVDLDGRRLRVVNPLQVRTTKKKSREVPIQPELYAILLYAAASDSVGRVVKDLPQQAHLWKAFRRVCKLAGLEPWARWCHTLRKNCETDWLRNYPAPAVCEWLGHDSSVMQDHYYKPTDDLFDAVAGVSKFTQKLTQTEVVKTAPVCKS